LSETILRDAVLPAARLARRRRAVQAGLASLAVLQWALAVPALFGDNLGMRMGRAMGAHSAHESAAWNLAIGAALLAVALKPARAAGTLPVLITFVAVLSVLSVPDLMAGAVSAARLASHAGVVLGLLLVALMARAQRMPGPRRNVGQLDGAGETRTVPRRSRGAA
jgi:predicted anti-sigma-YlaC factor YlaD